MRIVKISNHLNEDWLSYKIMKYYRDFLRGCPRGAMVKATDCGIVVSEFVLQSPYYVPFRTNTLTLLILPAMG